MLWKHLRVKKVDILNPVMFEAEIKHVESQDGGEDYYCHIYENVEIDENNPCNSHIMYACGKVKQLEKDKRFIPINGIYSIPDIDCDVESTYRDDVIEFIRKKYVNISYITTFTRMKARSAIKDIFRVLDVPNSFDVANRISKYIVPEDKISDVLEDMREDNPDYNGIDYAIDNVPEIKPYYEEYREAFETAKYFAKIIRNHGRHAAGIVVCDSPIVDTFPCLYDEKLGEHIAGLEMLDLEYCGGCKYDILGVAAYERIHQVWNLVDNGGVETTIEKVIKEDLDKVRGD